MLDREDEGSWEIAEPMVKQLIAKPDFPRLISFPRTGSHWLRMLMELYFEKPSLVRAFYFKEAAEFTCYHRHDQELNEQCKNVIYLYRNPVDTIYSQLAYYKENICSPERIKFWTQLYARHLVKWLFEENFTTKKTIITYEGLQRNLCGEFEKICCHLNVAFDPGRIAQAAQEISKEKLKDKTRHDPQVINLSSAYVWSRETFKEQNAKAVFSTLLATDARLGNMFPCLSEL
ncbi:MAG: sulfotransferase domain-containing protein [Pseudomonadota bacterium]